MNDTVAEQTDREIDINRGRSELTGLTAQNTKYIIYNVKEILKNYHLTASALGFQFPDRTVHCQGIWLSMMNAPAQIKTNRYSIKVYLYVGSHVIQCTFFKNNTCMHTVKFTRIPLNKVFKKFLTFPTTSPAHTKTVKYIIE